MNVLYHNRHRDYEQERQLGAKYVDFEGLLSESDFVSVHVSFNTVSKQIINKAALQKMKRTAFLINTSRGQVVSERDLARALKRKLIAGAGLDVFEKEPLRRTSPLAKMQNVVLLPHVGSATTETRSRMGEVAVGNLLDVLEGREPNRAYLVNPEIIPSS